MFLTELLPKLKDLPRVDKIRLMHFLITELAKEEGLASLEADAAYPLWAPYNAFGAASTLLTALEEEQITYGNCS